MFLENFKRFIKCYGEGKKFQIFGFFLLSLIAGLFEFVGIALVYPFIIMIVSPDNIPMQLLRIFELTHTQNPMINALIIGVIVLSIFIAKNLLMILIVYLQNKFVANWKLDINKKIMTYYLRAPYGETMKIPEPQKLYTLNVLSNNTIDGFVIRAMNFLTNSVIVGLIILLLFVKFPFAAAITLVFITASMIFQNKYFKKRTALVAQNMEKISNIYNNDVMENINNIKEIKMLSCEKYFFDKYFADEKIYRNVQTNYLYYSGIPPYIVEILIVIALMILAGLISIQNINSHASMIASFAVIVAAIFRIAPTLNRIQTSIINMNANRDYVIKLNNFYEKHDLKSVKIFENNKNKKINFRSKIELKNINFEYENNKPILKNVSFEINKGDFIGLVGLSGAGKSTLADIILGLLQPQTGSIFVDGVELSSKNYPMFRHITGYVPQQINMLDKSIRENVAWGIAPEEIDDDRVINSLKMARIYDTVEGFTDGIYSTVTTDSNGLSQGQKQRIAIARALYRNPEILIFDEATSSLDVQVESEITEMLTIFKNAKTIIAIAHRLSTLKACNKIIYMKDGSVTDVGTFEELSARHADFENLVKLSSLHN